MTKKKNRKLKSNQSKETINIKEKKFNIKFFLVSFGIFVFALFYNQWVTLEKLSGAVNPIARFGTISQFIQFLDNYGYRIFNGFDKFIFYILIIIPFFYLFFEWKNKYLTRLIDFLPKDNKYIFFYLFVLSFISLRSYFAIGNDLYTGDAPYFMLLTKLMTDNFKNFIFFPYWTWMYGGGAPFNQFYGPLHSYVAAFFNILTNNIYLATKISLFTFHFLSVIGIYLFIKETSNSKKAGIISALAGILLYHHIHVIIFPGRYGIASIWAVYPFLFYFFEKFLKDRKMISGLGMSISIAFMVFASIGMSFYFFVFWGVYIFFRLFLYPTDSFKTKAILFFKIALFSFLGLFLSSFYLYSFLKEGQWSSYGKAFGKYKIGGIGKNIFKQIFLWNNYQISLFNFEYAWQSSYFGISLIMLSFISIFYGIKNKVVKYFPLFITLFFLLLYVIGYGKWKILLKIPYLHTYSQVRSFNILAFFVIFLSGIGFCFLNKIFHKKTNIFLIVSLIILIDLFPTTFHDTFDKQYGDYGSIFLKYLKNSFGDKKDIPDFRIDILGKGESRSIHDNWRPYDAFIPETGCPLVSESGNDYVKIIQFVRYFHNHLYLGDSSISMNTFLNFYYLFNTRFILSTIDFPKEYFKSYKKNGPVVFMELKKYSPVLITTYLTNVSFSTNLFLPFLNSIHIDQTKNIVNKMYIINSKTTNLHSLNSEIKILQHKITKRKVYLILISSENAFAILSYAAYPTVKVFLDKKPIKYFETIYGNIVIPIHSGKNEIIIRPSRSKGAFFFFIIPTILFACVVFYIGLKIYKIKFKV